MSGLQQPVSGAIMDTFRELRTIATMLSEDGEFPTWLVTDILAIADKHERYTDKIHLVKQLITQISNFDAYAGTGCFDTSVSADTIENTIRKIVAK
jgi:hypothetical protein